MTAVLLVWVVSCVQPERAEEGPKPVAEAKTQALITKLKSDDSKERVAAAVALGKAGDLRAIGAMIDALDDPQESVRDALATAMGKMGPDAAKPRTKATARGSVHIRWGAMRSLGELQPLHQAGLKDLNDRRVPVFLKGLKDDDWNIRWIAAISLGKVKDERAVAPLVKALKAEDNALVREQIVGALDALKDRRVTLELMESLRGADVKQRATIAGALRKVTGAKVEQDTFDAWKAWYDKTK